VKRPVASAAWRGRGWALAPGASAAAPAARLLPAWRIDHRAMPQGVEFLSRLRRIGSPGA
jgi:hypothetical protein